MNGPVKRQILPLPWWLPLWLVMVLVGCGDGGETPPPPPLTPTPSGSFTPASASNPAPPTRPAPPGSVQAMPADPPIGDPITVDPAEVAHGIVVSCRRNGPGEWDGPDMQPLLEHLRPLGVDAIQVHPYAAVSRDGGIYYQPRRVELATIQPLRLARQQGMTAFLKPHLAYWGSGFGWRGEITFDRPEQWERFFAGYRDFILHQARCAQQADAQVFAVGTELDRTLVHEDRWRQLIAEVRGVYDGKLTYAANWDDVHRVGFWDALDYVGVQAYFPLSGAAAPSDAQLTRAWRGLVDRFAALSRQHGRPVLLTELGYAVSEAAADQPWADHAVGDSAAGAELKLRCMRIALAAIEDQPHLAGVYLWKWFPDNREQNREFTLQYDAMRHVIAEAWSRHADAGPVDD